MEMIKRKFIKFFGFSLISAFFFPTNFLLASNKKLINPTFQKTKRYNVQ